jgi:hypothetical protein
VLTYDNNEDDETSIVVDNTASNMLAIKKESTSMNNTDKQIDEEKCKTKEKPN